MFDPVKFYTRKHDDFTVEFLKLKSKLRWFGWYRFLSFVFTVLPLIVFGFNWLAGGVSLVFFSLFLYLIKANVKLERSKNKAAVLKKLAEDELMALDHSFLHFPDGEEFLDVGHFYSHDLDLFGKGSLFQYLNRAATLSGKHELANWLMHPFRSAPEIKRHQDAVSEMAYHVDWRLEFIAEGKLFNETEQISNELRSWSETNLELKKPKQIKWLRLIVPALTLVALVPGLFGITFFWFGFMVLMQWLLLYFFWKRITLYFKFFGRKSEILSKYMQLLHLIEYGEFQSEYLCYLQGEVKKTSAGLAFKQLKSLVKEFEYRQNMIVGFVLNSVFLWDIRCVYKLWEWHSRHRSDLAKWLNVVAKTDALVSLGNYAGNHPLYVFPEIETEDFVYKATDLGHPLLKPGKMVRNGLSIEGHSKILIVTGANMAGKSTFLRTVGVNLLLAEIGAPVCATKMQFSPIAIYTNMRTTDSLLKDESYFFAELKRIKTVLEHLQNGERYFVILDEMLKGTNSIDKLNGSKELIRKLVQLEAVALIATHDLKLSEMQTEFPDRVSNKCFEIRIENNEMVFDYKLSDGVTQTMNATFLMKKMGII